MVFQSQRQLNNQNFARQMPNDFWFPNRGYNQVPSGNNLSNIVQRFLTPTGNANVTDIASKGVGGISKTLNNVQQVLRVVDTATPIVKQYGPMVRNLPAMYRMIKAFKNTESTDTDLESSNHVMESTESLSSSSIGSLESPVQKSRSGQSTPKLFI